MCLVRISIGRVYSCHFHDTRSYQLRWGDWEMGSVISYIKCCQLGWWPAYSSTFFLLQVRGQEGGGTRANKRFTDARVITCVNRSLFLALESCNYPSGDSPPTMKWQLNRLESNYLSENAWKSIDILLWQRCRISLMLFKLAYNTISPSVTPPVVLLSFMVI